MKETPSGEDKTTVVSFLTMYAISTLIQSMGQQRFLEMMKPLCLPLEYKWLIKQIKKLHDR